MSIDFDSAALQTQQEEEEYDQEDYAREQEHYVEHDQGSFHGDYSYRSHSSTSNSHHLQTRPGHFPEGWDPNTSQNYQYQSGDYPHSSAASDVVHTHEQNVYAMQCEGGFPETQGNNRNHFQVYENGGGGNTEHYKATYHPHQPQNEPKMFNPSVTSQNGHFDQLQRDFLDSVQNTADGQQLAQLQILNRAQSRQIEELEQKLEDCRRRMRYLEHQFTIVKDEKDGLTVSLKESNTLVEEAKEREAQLQVKIRSMEKQMQSFTDREQEIMKQQHAAEAAMDSMKQQMTELCRSETLSRAREQHDRDTTALREQYEARMLTLQQKLDAQSQALNQQVEVDQRLQEQLRMLERQREEYQLDRAAVINVLTQRLEESQQQCAKLLQTGSVQEVSQLQMKLQQAQSARAISEDLSKALQEEQTQLKEQINVYESAIKCGALASIEDVDNKLSESYMDLGIRKSKWRNGRIHSTPHVSETGDLKEDVVRELKGELQRCLGHLKSKRLKICELQEELRRSQSKVEQMQTQIDQADRNMRDVKVRESNLEKQLEASAPQKELSALEIRNQELKLNEEKLKAANSELCTKMREMIHELDQEKQEAAQREERTQQQFRDDVVKRVREELTREHADHMEQLSSQHQQNIQQLESALAELRQEVLAVQECYIAVCKEKDKLEESLQSQLQDERRLKEEELLRREESDAALKRLASDLERQHLEDVSQLKAQWKKEAEIEIELRLGEQLDKARTCWQLEQEKLEKSWSHRLQEAEHELRKALESDTRDGACQTGFHFQQALEQSQKELHSENLAEQLEGAIARARSQWLQELTTLPEYKNGLQMAKEEWERNQQLHLQEQVSSAVKLAEETLKDALLSKCSELEHRTRTIEELQQEVQSLREQKEKIHSSLETNLLQAVKSTDAGLQETLRDKEKEWMAQQEIRLHEEKQRVIERFLQDLKEVLQEIVELRGSPDGWTLCAVGTVRSKIRDICSDALNRAKQQWKKSSEDKLKAVLKETQERHEAEIDAVKTQRKLSESSETLSKLQKKNQELQRHLEKACRQLQRSVREHRSTLQKMKDEHEAALQKEQQDHLEAVEELKRAQPHSSDAVSQQNLQAGLEEMKEQYMKAVEKIKAAELIRSEVLKERQETARRMRSYYLSCLQELLEDEGQTAGAEKKIINAASKLAAMAKVLETPVARRKNSKMVKSRGGSDSETSDSSNKTQSHSSHEGKALDYLQEHQVSSLADTNYRPMAAKQKGVNAKSFPADSLEPTVVCASKESFAVPQVTQKHTQVMFDTDAKNPNLTLRKQSSEGFESGRTDPFLMEEAPVRDGGHSEWSLTSTESNIHLTSSYPEPAKPFPISRSVADTSDVTIYKEIVRSQTRNHGVVDRRVNKRKEPIPRSEGRSVRKICSKGLFSQVGADSGFDSPLALPQKSDGCL
ncbi:hypothetical protein DNTS_014786 [Danionella cerebrum]|uniref:CEP152 CEP63 binding coiled coil domain-containing protein n=1 Tax=Danionella cerebrum TaxID=2873325 RepID=A0A553QH60_9TELE|nr:hypothetical protein DNTS_014786 [Danionella translucida]